MKPETSVAGPFELALYRHILAPPILLAVTICLAFRRRRVHWRQSAEMILKLMPRDRETPDEFARAEYYGADCELLISRS